jgi:hypothetical protein
MCVEMPVILVNKVVDPKRMIGKMEGQGGGEAQGVADQKNELQIAKFLEGLGKVISLVTNRGIRHTV